MSAFRARHVPHLHACRAKFRKSLGKLAMWRKHALNCATEGARQKVCARRSRRSAFGAPPQAPCEQLRSPKCWRRCDALRPTLARKPPVWRPARLGRRKGVIEESPGSHRVNAAGDQRARHWADWGAAPVLRWRRWRLARRDARMKTRGDSWTESTRRSSLCAFCRASAVDTARAQVSSA